MKKRILIYVFGFAIFCTLGNSFVNYTMGKQIENQSPYYLCFASIGANLLESRLDCWAKIDIANNYEDMNHELIQILTYLKLPLKTKEFQYQETKLVNELKYGVDTDQGTYTFVIQTDKKEKGQSYFLMTMTSAKGDKSIRETNRAIKELLDCKSYFSYKGLIDSALDINSSTKLLEVIMKCLEIGKYDLYQDQNLCSVTGYSPKLVKLVKPASAGKTNYNIQAAIKYDRTNNKSYVYMGFPLLLNDY